MEDRKTDLSWTKYFNPCEFDDPDCHGSWVYMRPGTIILLDILRHNTGWPIITHNTHGLRGCVCVQPTGHSKQSLHYVDNPEGCSAVDWHFQCEEDPREQAMHVLESGFRGIGIYYDWKWGGKPLPVGFHTDMRMRPQIWKREKGKYVYFLK